MSPHREGVACPECGSENPAGSKFCELCGLRLVTRKRAVDADGGSAAIGDRAAAPTGKRRTTRRRSGSEPARVADSERREVERAVARARSRLKGIRTLLTVLAVLNGLFALIYALLYGHIEVYRYAAIIGGAVTLLLVAAAIFLYDQPLFWVLTVAGVFTVSTILAPGLIAILICISLWGAVPILLNVTRLQREYPDLITPENLKRRKRQRLSAASEARLEERAASRRAAATRSYLVVAGVLLVGVVAVILMSNLDGSGGTTVRASGPVSSLSAVEAEARSKAFDATLGDFESVWARSDKAGVEAFGSAEFLAERWAKVKDILERRGWSDKFPEIEFYSRVGSSEDTREVWFDVTPKGKLKTHWVYERDRWRLRRIVFSRTR